MEETTCKICGLDVLSCDCSEEDHLAWLLHGRRANSEDMHGGMIFMKATTEITELRDQLVRLRERIVALAERLECDALSAVPDDYAKRDMHHKYLNGDCHAGGLMDAAHDVRALLNEDNE